MSSVYNLTKANIKLWALLQSANGNLVTYREIFMHLINKKKREERTHQEYQQYGRAQIARLRKIIGMHNIRNVLDTGYYLRIDDE